MIENKAYVKYYLIGWYLPQLWIENEQVCITEDEEMKSGSVMADHSDASVYTGHTGTALAKQLARREGLQYPMVHVIL